MLNNISYLFLFSVSFSFSLFFQTRKFQASNFKFRIDWYLFFVDYFLFFFFSLCSLLLSSIKNYENSWKLTVNFDLILSLRHFTSAQPTVFFLSFSSCFLLYPSIFLYAFFFLHFNELLNDFINNLFSFSSIFSTSMLLAALQMDD